MPRTFPLRPVIASNRQPASTLSPPNGAYICLACRTFRNISESGRNVSTFHLSKSRPTKKFARQRKELHQRFYSQSQSLQATEQVTQNAKSFMLDHKFYGGANKTKTSATASSAAESSIRQSLKAWGLQNNAVKLENAPSELPAEGRISMLPSAVFLNKSGDILESLDHDESLAEASDTLGAFASLPVGALFFHDRGTTGGQYVAYCGGVGSQDLLLYENGKWSLETFLCGRRATSTRARHTFVPDFLSKEEVAAVTKHMPKDPVLRPLVGGESYSEIDVSRQMPPNTIKFWLERIRQFRKDVDASLRELTPQLDATYDMLASDEEFRIVSAKEYVHAALGIDLDAASQPTRMAIESYIYNQEQITPSARGRTLKLLMSSKKMNRNMQTVVKWAREYQDLAAQAAIGRDISAQLKANHLSAFIDKARRLILKSRKFRAPTVIGSLGPSVPLHQDELEVQRIDSGEVFDDLDRVVIDFLWNTCLRQPAIPPVGRSRSASILALVLRAVGAYPNSDKLGAKSGRLFLKEIGSADPWSPRYANNVILPIAGLRPSSKLDQLSAEHTLWQQAWQEGAPSSGQYAVKDKMPHLRRQWDCLALCIDSENAKISEDAISVEPAQDMSDTYWIHIHCSHITAFFDPNSFVDRYSRTLGSSYFTSGVNFNARMLPRTIARDFGLRVGSPVMTISTLISGDGRVHEVQAASGVLRKVEKLNDRAVQDMFGTLDPDDAFSRMVVGRVPKIMPDPIPASDLKAVESHRSLLATLQRLLGARNDRRRIEMPVDVDTDRVSFSCEVKTTMKIDPVFHREHQSFHWKGDPAIIVESKMAAQRGRLIDMHQSLLSRAVRLGAESTGRWLAERKIPALFIGNAQDISMGTSEEMRRKILVQGQTNTYTRPINHMIWHMQTYALASSPLRRYPDMLNQQQITSYLLAVDQGLIESNTSVCDESVLAYNEAAVEDYLASDASATNDVKGVSVDSRESFLSQALFRAFHFKEAQLPEVWEVLIRKACRQNEFGLVEPPEGQLAPFGLAAKIGLSEAGWEKRARTDQFLPVRLDVIDPDARQCYCVPVGPPTDEQQFRDPFQAWTQANIAAPRSE